MDWVAGLSFLLVLVSVCLHGGVLVELRGSASRFAAAWFWMSAGAAVLAAVYLVLFVWRLDGVEHGVWCDVADVLDLAAWVVVWILPAGVTWAAARANRGRYDG